MKKIFWGTGAAILFVAGTLAGRTSKKFVFHGLYFTGPGILCTELVTCAPVTGLFNTTSGGFQAQLNTASANTKMNLYATSACIDKAYFVNL